MTRVTTLRAGAALALAMLGLGVQPAEAQSWRTVTMSRQLSGEEVLDVRVNYGVGRMVIGSSDSGVLYQMRLRYDEESFEPMAQYEDGHLGIGVKQLRKRIRVGRNHDEGEMELRLARNVPMALGMDFGAVRADVDLGGLSLVDLELKTGASDAHVEVSSPNVVPLERARFEAGAAEFTASDLGNLNAEEISVSAGVGDITLEFTGEWQRDADVSVRMGLGSLKLHFPEGLGVRVEKSTFLTSFDSEGLVKRGDAYYSLDWEDAPNRVTVEVDAAFGGIEIVWVR